MVLIKLGIFGTLLLFSLLSTFATLNQIIKNSGWRARNGVGRRKVNWVWASLSWTATILWLVWASGMFNVNNGL
jgi:hypothetical protein